MQGIDFSSAWSLLEIARAAELSVSERLSSPLDCEIIGEAPADWYLVRTMPGDEDRALRWLTRRRFGAFKPEQRRRNSAGVPILRGGLEPMFPGWLFVFAWDIARMRSRILACPGVTGLLCFPNTNLPVAIDRHRHVDERGRRRELSFVDELRRIHEAERELAGARAAAGYVNARARRNAQRLQPRERKELQRLAEQAKSRGIYTPDEWLSISALAPHERIGVLMRALAAPLQVASSGAGGRDGRSAAAKAKL